MCDEELELTPEETTAYVQLAEHTRQILSEEKLGIAFQMTDSSASLRPSKVHLNGTDANHLMRERVKAIAAYPRISKEVILNALKQPKPAWYLTADTRISAINLLVLWLLGGLLTPSIDKEKLLGWSSYDVYTRPEEFTRIAMPENQQHFWWKKLLQFLLLEDDLPSEICERFRHSIEAHPFLSLLLHDLERKLALVIRCHSKPIPTYSKIQPPKLHGFGDPPNEFLLFNVTIAIYQEEYEGQMRMGFGAVFEPKDESTLSHVKREHDRLIGLFGEKEYIQYERDEWLGEARN